MSNLKKAGTKIELVMGRSGGRVALWAGRARRHGGIHRQGEPRGHLPITSYSKPSVNFDIAYLLLAR